MAGWLRRTLADPKIGKHLLREEGEVIVDEVKHHWVVYTRPVVEVTVAFALLVLGVFSSVQIAWLPWVIAGGLAAHAGWRALSEHMDRFGSLGVRFDQRSTRRLNLVPE